MNLLRSVDFTGNLLRNAEGVSGGGAPVAPPPAPAMAGAASLVQEPAGGTPAAAPAASTGGEGEKPWWDTLPDNLKTTAAAKQWKDPAAAIESYVNLEKIMGADKAGRTIMLPKDDASPEEVGAFFKSLGVPETADKYDIKVPQGLQSETVDQAKGWMHEAGVPPKLAQRLVDSVAKAESARWALWEKASNTEMNDLAVEWGAKFDDNAEVARRAVKTAGLDQAALLKMEMAIGTKNLMTMFHKFGMNLNEAAAPAPGNGGGQFVMNKAQAQSKVDALRANSDFQARYLSPNIQVRNLAIAELEELTRIAAG